MEASQDEATGNGFVVIVNQYEPGAIVRLFRVDSDTVLRAEGGVQVDERVVDEFGEVGFSGLTAGDRYIAAGFSRGRYEEVRTVAQDPSSNVELLQPPVEPSPQTLGTQETNTVSSAAAPSDAASTLGVGIPDEVASPLLTERADPAAPETRADAGVTPGDVDGVTEPTAPVTTDGSGEAAGTDAPAQEAPAEPAAPETVSPAPEAAPAVPTPEADSAPVAEANPPAPEAGTPDASDSSGTGEANGGAVEEPKETPPAKVEFHSGVTAEPEATPTVEAVPAVDPSAPSLDGQVAEPSDPASEGNSAQLVQQAEGLGIPNATTLQDAELRQAISEKNVTPVA